MSNANPNSDVQQFNGRVEIDDLHVNAGITLAAGSVSAPAGSIPLSAVSGFSNSTFNVKDYGAKLDGVTDDYTAFANANTAAAAVNGVVLVPAGTAVLGTMWVPSSNVRIQGAGKHSTTLKQKGANTNLVAVIGIADGTTGVTISDLTIDGNRANNNGNTAGINLVNQPSGNTAGIQILRVHVQGCSQRGMVLRGQRIFVEGCTATDCGYDGFLVTYDYSNPATPSTGIITKDVSLVGCAAYSNNVTSSSFHGFGTLGPAKSGWGALVQDVSFTGCQSYQNGTTGTGGVGGFRSVSNNFVGTESGASNNVGCKDIAFVSCQATANADDGFWIQGSNGVNIIGCTVDGNYTGSGVQQKGFGIEIQGSQETHVIGCKIRDVGAQGIIISASDAAATTWNVNSFGNVVDGCTVDNCGLGAFSAAKASGVRIEQANDTYPNYANRITNCAIRGNAQAGIEISVTNDWIISGCQIEDNGAGAVVGSQQGIELFGNGSQMQLTNGLVVGCIIRDTRSGASRTQSYGIQDNSINVDGNSFVENTITNHVTGAYALAGTANQIWGKGIASVSRTGGITWTDGYFQVAATGYPSTGAGLEIAYTAPNTIMQSYDRGAGAAKQVQWLASEFYLPTPAGGIQASASLFAGSGAPNNANGNNGDYYFRSDTPATANQRIYVKSAGAWVGIV